MKVQLIVVQGRSEGKTISLVGPVFRIGRGETCHLRPNSERVSREHAEISLRAGSVMIRDLGSRNGTLVNGKALTQPLTLKDRDLVQVGPLTFAVSVLETDDAEVGPATPSDREVEPATLVEAAGRNPSELGQSVADAGSASGLRGSETILIPAFIEAVSRSEASITFGDDPDDDEYERHPIVEGETVYDLTAADFSPPAPPPVAGKKVKPEPGGKKTGNSAAEILRKMMERRPLSN